MNKERLLNVAKALREGKPEDFSMRNYGNACGTPACALGHYASRRDLQERFELADRYDIAGGHIEADGRAVYFDGRAVLEHFDISSEDAETLFGEAGCGYAKTNVVAAAFIEQCVSDNAIPDPSNDDER